MSETLEKFRPDAELTSRDRRYLTSPSARTRQPGMLSSRPRGPRRSRDVVARIPTSPTTGGTGRISLSSSDARGVFSFGPVKGDLATVTAGIEVTSPFSSFFFFIESIGTFETRFVFVRRVRGRRVLVSIR